jgi:hypothetical protein
MLKKIADAAPAAFIALGSGSILSGLFDRSQTIERVQEVLPYPWSIFWLSMMVLGSLAVVAGICLRSRIGENGRKQDIGQGLELAGNFAVGSGFLVYALVLEAIFPFWTIFPSLCWFLALASCFYGPFVVIVRDIGRAHQHRET